MSVARSVLDDLSSPCCFLEGAVDDHQIVDIKQCAHTMAVEHYRHDSCPNPGRSRPPDRQGHMGELDHLMVKVTQVQRCLSR